MLALFLIGGWADGRFTEWLLHGTGRPEVYGLAGALILLIGLWRMAVRNTREHEALARAHGRKVETARSEED